MVVSSDFSLVVLCVEFPNSRRYAALMTEDVNRPPMRVAPTAHALRTLVPHQWMIYELAVPHANVARAAVWAVLNELLEETGTQGGGRQRDATYAARLKRLHARGVGQARQCLLKVVIRG